MLDDRDGVESWLEGMDGLHPDPRPRPLRGSAHHRGRRSSCSRPTGSSSTSAAVRSCPTCPGLADVDYLTNVGILELDTVPEHLVIVGGSYIALEFAQMYRRFGAERHRRRAGPAADRPRGRGRLRRHQGHPRERGHRRRCSVPTRCGIAKQRQRFRPSHPATAPQPIAGSHLLVAMGRRPNTDDLGLERRGRRDRRARLHRRRRPTAHQRRTHLGDGRLQRQRRVHPHVLQRLRDRRRQPARRRPAPGQRPHHHLRAVHRPAAGPGRA